MNTKKVRIEIVDPFGYIAMDIYRTLRASRYVEEFKMIQHSTKEKPGQKWTYEITVKNAEQ